eukprot:gene1796-2002_t
MNEYFSSIGRQLAAGFEDLANETFENIYGVTPSFSQIELTEKQLIDKLKHIKQKTGGTGNITSRELSEAGETLTESLYSIFKNSIKNSVHPCNWKTGMVIPAFKKSIKSDRANYRPLTMLNLNSKILESVVSDSLDNHLTQNKVLHPNQWGFKKGISTELLLLHLTETWKKALDLDYKIGVVFVDFKKAFDTVNHNVLKLKLLAAAVSGAFHEWLVSYISGRSQYVVINGMK